MLRNCWICKMQKEDTEFYFQKIQNKYSSRCKSCHNKRANTRISQLPGEKRRALWVRATRKAQIVHPERFSARKQARQAMRAGTLAKLPCEVCNDIDTQAHHDDYSKPLEVRWLCHKHHRAHHYPKAYRDLLAKET